MRPELKARLTEGVLLWLQLAFIGAVHGLPGLGIQLPLLERTALWQLQQSPGLSALIAGFTTLMLLALWGVPADARRTRLALAGVLLLAGIAGALLFTPMLVFTFGLSARSVAQPFRGARFQAPPRTQG